VALLVARCFAGEQAAIEKLEAEAAALAQSIDELLEEHGGDDGLLADARNDKDKITKVSATARLHVVKGDKDAADERKVLVEFLSLVEKEQKVSASAKAAHEALTAKIVAKYAKLTDDDIKTMVVDDKWLATTEAAIRGEIDRVSHTLTSRISELADRYVVPMSVVLTELATHAGRVDETLKRMGATL